MHPGSTNTNAAGTTEVADAGVVAVVVVAVAVGGGGGGGGGGKQQAVIIHFETCGPLAVAGLSRLPCPCRHRTPPASPLGLRV